MSLLRTNMRPRLRFAVVPIVILLILPGVATTHGDHGVASTLAPQRTQALSMRSYNTATGPHPGPLSNTGAIVATLVLKNGTVVPGNFLGSGVGVVASAIVYDTAEGWTKASTVQLAMAPLESLTVRLGKKTPLDS